MAVEIKKINGVYMGSQEIASTRFATDATLKAYYKFSTGALTADSSGAAHTLTAISDPAEVAGKFGGGVDLDGNDAYSATDHADFKPTGAFSVGGWIKTTATASQRIFQSYSANTNEAGFQLFTSSGYVAILSGKNTGTTQGTDWQALYGILVNDGNWRFVVGTSDGTNLKMYVDGKLVSTGAWANNPAYAATNYVRIGCQNSAGTDAVFFTGSLDDLFLLNGTALTPDEIYSLYKTGVKKLNGQVNLNPELESTSLRGDANLQLYQRFEGNSIDETANNNDGTDTAITYGTTYGKMGQGALFNGTSSKIVTGNCNIGTDFTVSIWIKADGNQILYSRVIENNYASGGFAISAKSTTTWDAGVNGTTLTTFPPIKNGVWNHLALVYNGASITLYSDGVPYSVASTTDPTQTNIPLYIGEYVGGGDYYFKGSMDDLAVFSRALTSTEISNLYNTNIKKYGGVSNT